MAIILVIVLLISNLTGCAGQTENTEKANETMSLSSENTSMTTTDGVTVDVGPYVLDDEAELNVKKLTPEGDDQAGWQIEAYDISLGEITELGDFITLRIPYDPTYCEDGQDPARCIGAKYKNEASGEWEDVLFEVDASKNELIIYTDHLSIFGAFYVKNEGMRSAYIMDIYESLAAISAEMATAAMSELSSNGGVAQQKSMEAGASIAAGLLGLSGDMGMVSDVSSTVINLATLGDPVFDSGLAQGAYDTLGDLGKVAAIVKFSSLLMSDTPEAADILSLYKDVSNIVIGSMGGAALGVAMSGVWIFDQVIGTMFEEGMAIKMEDMGAVYQHFNNHFKEGQYAARSLKDWRTVMIDMVEDHPNDEAAVQTALEEEIDRYARVFWSIPDDVLAAVTSDAGLKRMPWPTSAEMETLTAEYKKDLYERLYPVTNSVRNYMAKKAEAIYLSSLNDMKDFYNQRLRINVKEEIPEGGNSAYADYVVRFAPLSDLADKRSWTGKITKQDPVSIEFTLLGFLQAGSPSELQLFKPGDDPETADPEQTLGYQLTAPVTEVSLGNAPTFDEVVGQYPDGTMVITEVFISDRLRAEIESSQAETEEDASGESENTTGSLLEAITDDLSEQFAGCDFASVILGLEEQIGVVNEMPLVIEKTDENTGTLNMGENPGPVTYDPNMGILSFSADQEGISMGGDLFASYNGDKTGVQLSGELKMNFILEELSADDFYVIMKIDGTKSLIE